MLEDIIISRVRVKILTHFLSHPGTIFHVRDIVRKVGEEINAVRRELAHMERAGMVSKEARANRLFYVMRKDYPLYFELLELIGKTIIKNAQHFKIKKNSYWGKIIKCILHPNNNIISDNGRYYYDPPSYEEY